MHYAIVDIETTGGHAAGNGITEVSIRLHDGKSVVGKFDSLINPGHHIPYYIRGLTGISDAMVANAPAFDEVAGDIFNMLNNNIFVAHSVNFDYSFLKHALAVCGYNLDAKKLCTVRLSRKIFPGIPSYSLGNLCGYLDITIENRHRAGGDADATVKLFELLLKNDNDATIEKFLKRNSKEQALPPNVPKEQFEKLPDAPGVYYFHDQKGKILYVGKAVSIKKRVNSHFSNNSPNKQKQDFCRNIYGISFEVCGNELMALVLESHQIKHYWPAFNRAQKRFEPVFGILEYFDQRGFHRLGIEKMKKGVKPLAAFSTMIGAFDALRSINTEFGLCPRLTGIATNEQQCIENNCACTKTKKKNITSYNKKVLKAVDALNQNESFVIVEQGRKEDEAGLLVVEKGSFKSMGYLPKRDFNNTGIEPAELEGLPLYRENFNIRQIINGYVNQKPENVIVTG